MTDPGGLSTFDDVTVSVRDAFAEAATRAGAHCASNPPPGADGIACPAYSNSQANRTYTNRPPGMS